MAKTYYISEWRKYSKLAHDHGFFLKYRAMNARTHVESPAAELQSDSQNKTKVELECDGSKKEVAMRLCEAGFLLNPLRH